MAELAPTCERCGAFVAGGRLCEACTQRAWDGRLDDLERLKRRRALGARFSLLIVVVLPLLAMVAASCWSRVAR